MWCTVEVREEHRLERHHHRQQQHSHQVGDREGDPGEDEDARGIPVPRQEEGADQAILTYFQPDSEAKSRRELRIYIRSCRVSFCVVFAEFFV